MELDKADPMSFLDETGIDVIRRIVGHYKPDTPDHEFIPVALGQLRAALRPIKASSPRTAAEGWRMVPTEATAENGMKAALIGDVLIPERDLHYVEGDNRRSVSWTAIKALYRQFLAAAPVGTIALAEQGEMSEGEAHKEAS